MTVVVAWRFFNMQREEYNYIQVQFSKDHSNMITLQMPFKEISVIFVCRLDMI